tara:strand:- start:525 stop:854 length:330 start_codon:yes stop_codon:yes gene_type:complete
MNLQKEKAKDIEKAIEKLNIKVSSVNKKIKNRYQVGVDQNKFKKILLNKDSGSKNEDKTDILIKDDLIQKIIWLENKNKKMTTYISLLILFFILLVVIFIDLNILGATL